MSWKPRGDWCYYGPCSRCGVAAASPCVSLTGLHGRMRHRDPIHQPHPGRPRFKTDQTPAPPAIRPNCPAQHPQFQVPCSLLAEHATWHLHHSRKFGTISWPT